jgi:lipase
MEAARPAGVGWARLRVPGEVELAVGRTGRGPDPIIAVHGITSQHRAFNAVARHLRHPHGMAAVDLRGRGDSGKPPSGYGFAAHAGDVLRVLDHLGIERAVLTGHSMGAFVVEEVALAAPDRVRRLVLLDGGWPRPAAGQREGAWDDPELQAGLARAFGRLTMTFPSPEAYLDFWFPGQGLTLDRLPDDVADFYRYDLARVPGGWRPKASPLAAAEDAAWARTSSAPVDRLRRIGCGVGLVRAAEGFAPGAPPVVGADRHRAIAAAFRLRADVLLEGATHYTMLLEPHAARVAELLDRAALEVW